MYKSQLTTTTAASTNISKNEIEKKHYRTEDIGKRAWTTYYQFNIDQVFIDIFIENGLIIQSFFLSQSTDLGLSTFLGHSRDVWMKIF